jgi:predicted DNA repair protein MutK
MIRPVAAEAATQGWAVALCFGLAGAAFMTQLLVLAGVAVLMTAGVYGFVAGIVKLDDLGLWLSRQRAAAARSVGAGLLRLAPWLMKFLSVAGTAAMFLVGGGILVHGIAPLHHAIEGALQPIGGVLPWLLEALANAGVGVVAGALVLAAVTLLQQLRGRRPAAGH